MFSHIFVDSIFLDRDYEIFLTFIFLDRDFNFFVLLEIFVDSIFVIYAKNAAK